MTAKHTPGPWTVSGQRTKYVESRIRRGWVQEIAAVGPTEADNGYGPQQEANARLIAAAPELLEALMLIAGTDPIDAALDPQRAVRVASEAIARATGETA